MTQQKKKKYFEASIVLAIVSIAITVFINIQIAIKYKRADGKTKALFGITELLSFGYKYYVAIFGIISLVYAVLNLKTDNQTNKKLTAFLLSLFAIAIVFARIWRLFV